MTPSSPASIGFFDKSFDEMPPGYLHLVALVRAGATFVDGLIIEREDQPYAA